MPAGHGQAVEPPFETLTARSSTGFGWGDRRHQNWRPLRTCSFRTSIVNDYGLPDDFALTGRKARTRAPDHGDLSHSASPRPSMHRRRAPVQRAMRRMNLLNEVQPRGDESRGRNAPLKPARQNLEEDATVLLAALRHAAIDAGHRTDRCGPRHAVRPRRPHRASDSASSAR